MIVISDTSPINYLILIGHIELLPALFGKIVVPSAVHYELRQDGAPPQVAQSASALPDWAEVRAAEIRKSFTVLDEGESEAISLALELNADFVLIDERKGRRVAREVGLRISSTLGVLELAAQQNLIDLTTALTKLRQTSFHVSEEVLKAVLVRNHSVDR